jgi:hypothetical protein
MRSTPIGARICAMHASRQLQVPEM